uniref:NADH dehydrogenase [ubiquinone] 1 subunit C1, mitochondrial n=1 Tax=Coturnix japonica TaxID=93934 RepID=A0A8C2SPS8_COTJA
MGHPSVSDIFTVLTCLKSSAFAAPTRSAFYARKRTYDQPNWFGVGLAFATSAALWAFLFKQHNEDVMEYERRKQERQHKCTSCS